MKEYLTIVAAMLIIAVFFGSCALIEANKSIECVKNGGEWHYQACRAVGYKKGLG